MKLNAVCRCEVGLVHTKNVTKLPKELGQKFIEVECKLCHKRMKISGKDMFLRKDLTKRRPLCLDDMMDIFYRDYSENVKYRDNMLDKEMSRGEQIREHMRTKKDIV